MASTTFADTLKVLDYLYSISGENTLAGQHNREPNSDPDKWTEYIYETTGKYPALWSGDFLYQQKNIDNRWTMIYEAKKQWDNGAVVSIMWHVCPPDMDEPCGWDPGVLNEPLTNDQWSELLTEGTNLNNRWKSRMDEIAVYLQYLKDNDVEVLWKPFHEMNQGKFWWGGRPGQGGTAKLYRYVHDYFTDVKGLTNLVWVWDMQDLSRDFAGYNPGDEYWDVFAFDIYDNGWDISWYNYILPIVGDKPMAIGECAKLPNTNILDAQPQWVFFMAWAELVSSRNSTLEIQNVYNNPQVITLDEMPGWGDSGEPYAIEMSADPIKLLNNGVSTAEIKIAIRDDAGILCNSATNEITYSIIGNGSFTSANSVNAEKGRNTIFFQSSTEVGTEMIIVTSPGLISDTVEIEITNFYNFDDFEHYKNSYELGNYWQAKSTSQVRIYLEKDVIYEGSQSMQFDYKIGNGAPPYSAIYRENVVDFKGATHLGFWYQPIGKSNQMAIRLSEGNGTNWDYYIDFEGSEGKYREIAFTEFAKYSGPSETINLSDIAEISFNILKGNGEYGESSIYFDDIKFLTESTIVSIENDGANNPQYFQLKQNYPNPFNPSTMINYQLPMISEVELSIYNMLGEKVTTLLSEKQEAGSYQVVWNAENYPSGIYMYKLVSEDAIEMKKCVLLK